MRRSLWLGMTSLAATAAAIAACTLNPQPLPPASPDGGILPSEDAGSRFGGSDGAAVPAPQDAADSGTTSGGGLNDDDGGDAGASTDASSDAETTSDASDASDQ
jgi:hypothetical protein